MSTTKPKWTVLGLNQVFCKERLPTYWLKHGMVSSSYITRLFNEEGLAMWLLGRGNKL
jgi:predicted thioredoxin/glutaredoxin